MTKINSIQNAIDAVCDEFPFKGYMEENIAPYKSVADTVVKYLEPGDTVYDFGSGPCDKIAVVQKLGFDCSAYDDLMDEWHRKGSNHEQIHDFAKKSGIHFTEEYKPSGSENYSMVMMNDVLEHIHDSPRELLNSLVGTIKPNGYLFITVPNLANIRKRLDLLRGRTNLPRYDLFYWYQGPWRGPVREYVRRDLEMMVDYLGLEQVELTTVHHMLKMLPSSLVAPYKLFTRVFPDVADTWLLVAKKPDNWESRTEISDSEFKKIYAAKNKTQLY